MTPMICCDSASCELLRSTFTYGSPPRYCASSDEVEMFRAEGQAITYHRHKANARDS